VPQQQRPPGRTARPRRRHPRRQNPGGSADGIHRHPPRRRRRHRGETTGWRLEGDGETGGLDVDVSKVRDRAKQLDGKRVTITGRTTRRNYVERGGTPVILAETIQPAPQPKK
jgi:hypothetical protein